MIKKIVAICSLLLSLNACISVHVPNPIVAVNEQREVYWHSFGMIYAYDAGTTEPGLIGTSFAISDDEMITAGHVCLSILTGQILRELEFSTRVTYLAGDKLKEIKDIEVVKMDTVNDLCLLKKKNHGLTPLKLAKSVSVGEDIRILGAPLGVFPMETDGKVMSLDSKHIDKELAGKILLSAPAFGGNSGGPIINEKAEVIGVLVMGARIYPQISFAVHLDILKDFIHQ